ncbi:N-acyl-L-amino acid amidohydrolase [[Clostridium] sordellii]|uniref:M20 metallopeptidase family protein n=1 Tax=Paraclostridium sordellii TaxID=1505 RepID=UPI0005E7E882|nr:amidohydrolase [Paeniclostridium sordellii]MDU4412474.1 amidohydrolase [Paeniclostridium sordellii]MDU6482588.1 amidohydrolase [Paeniclostridium sordellii]MRZ28212.1 amidohydrolase [Paeniclostridium sordellii]MVO73774.1 amidohydrolase [Paeniclostridium sordellii]CEO36059.1 N-acyl-L-amino acid amidohydrolase [[Clostridium] sordellii] [Paeniclostridium sordellii]
MENINNLIEKYLNEVISIRRNIHQNPELSLKEFKTSKLVVDSIKDLNLDIKSNVGKTGVVANLNNYKDKKTLLIRSDMDALPINELSNVDFKSKTSNVMHACGHDVHTSILIGSVKVLHELKDNLNGNIKFVFQPAEENNPVGGAPLMIEEGVLENPKVDAALALHLWDLPVGKIATKKGAIMCQSDRIFIDIKGKSAHGSAPHMGNDAIVCAGHLITALQTVVSRNVSPCDNAVVTISNINGGLRYNVIPENVKMEGTVRCASKELGKYLPARIEEIIKGICTTFNCSYEFKYSYGYPVTYNDEIFTHEVIKSLQNNLGFDNVEIPNYPTTCGEDFAYFTQHVPSTFLLLGCKSEFNKDTCILHNPNFTCDEDCIKYGIKALVTTAIDYLNKQF